MQQKHRNPNTIRRSPIDGLCGNPGNQVVIPIRMKRRDKPPVRAQPAQDNESIASQADDPERCYPDSMEGGGQ